jgi:hypothetical protein
MFDNFEPIEQRLFKVLLMNVRTKPEIVLKGTSDGFEVFVTQGKDVFKLFTQRKSARVFKSPSTAINFLVEMGADRIVIDGLGSWKPDTYVNQNSRPKKKKATVKTRVT